MQVRDSAQGVGAASANADAAAPVGLNKQRWYVAVLYVDLCRSTQLAERLDAEVYAEVMDALKLCYRQTIVKHGGTLLQLHGDGMLAMFGFPAAGEEDVRLAVNAALDVHEQVAGLQLNIPELDELNFLLRLHSGVHAGLVVVQEGDVYAGTFQLRSEVTNICARLSDEADEDEILVSEESLRGSEPFFKCGESRMLALRGISQPVNVIPVHARSELLTQYQARRKRSRLPFVGRSLEQSTLQGHLIGARKGKLQIVSIVGAPGVGKTRLVDEFMHTIGDDLLMRGHCVGIAKSRPLQPFLDMFDAINQRESPFADLLKDFSSLAGERQDDSFGDSSSENQSVEDGRAGSKSALVEQFLERAVQLQPVVLFIDDWQWVDDLSRELLARIAEHSDWPLLVVLTARSLDPVDSKMLSPMTVLPLDGLKGHEVEDAVKMLLPHIDPFIADKIRLLCGGNPLFLEELCHTDSVDKLDHAPSKVEHVPQWLYSVVQARVSQLSSMEQNIVQVAAVIGNKVPFWLLQRVADFQSVQDLTGLAVFDLLFPSERSAEWRFKHGLTREIVYDLVGLRKRQALHKNIAEAFAEQQIDNEHVEALAYHYHGAAMYEQAHRHALDAGDLAMAVPALDIASVQYRLAIECLDRGKVDEDTYAQIFSLVRRLNNVSMLDPDPDQIAVLRRFLASAERFDDHKGLALGNYWLGTAFYGLGRPRDALHYHYRARTLAQAIGHEKLVVETNFSLGQAKAANCEHDAALGILDQAIAAGSQLDRMSPQAVSVAYSTACKGMVLADQGEFANAHKHLASAKSLFSGLSHPAESNVLAKGVLFEIWQGKWDEAKAAAEELEILAENIKNFYLFSMARMLSAYSTWMQSNDETSIDIMIEATDWLRSYGKGQFLSLNYGWLAEVCQAQGDLPGVRVNAARAIKRSRLGDRYGEASAYRSLALAVAQSPSDRWSFPAAHYLAKARSSANQRASNREIALVDLCEATILDAQGDQQGALGLRQQASAAFSQLDMAWHADKHQV